MMCHSIAHALRAGLGELLSEHSQAAMAASLALAATGRAASETVIVVCLREISMLLISVRERGGSARDSLLQGERPLLSLIEHPSRPVRLAACLCLWSVSLAFPAQLSGLLNTTINRVRSRSRPA